jgi:hypothetical protein
MQIAVHILPPSPMDYPSLLPATFYWAVTYESLEPPPLSSYSPYGELNFGELVFR